MSCSEPVRTNANCSLKRIMMNCIISGTGRLLALSSVSRHLGTRTTNSSSHKSPLYLLRQKTGMAYSLCREALNKYDNDLDRAETWLKAQELTHGLQKATIVKGRAALEGLIGLAIRNDNKLVTVVELNCETDFVAKNQLFKDFAVDLTHQIATSWEGSKLIDQQNHIKVLEPSDERLRRADTEIAPLISKLGENIKITRAAHYLATNEDVFMSGQVHAKAHQISTDMLNVIAGRYGAIIAIQSQHRETNRLAKIRSAGDRLCQHVIGYSPAYIELPNEIREQLEKIEKEEKEHVDDTSNLLEEGNLSDEEERGQSRSSRDDWPSLMDQTLIMSDDTTVRDFCKLMEIDVTFFKRFECGLST